MNSVSGVDNTNRALSSSDSTQQRRDSTDGQGQKILYDKTYPQREMESGLVQPDVGGQNEGERIEFNEENNTPLTAKDSADQTYKRNVKRAALLFGASIFIVILVFAIISAVNYFKYNEPEPLQNEPNYSAYSQVINITLLGDSQINEPYTSFNLASKLRSKVSGKLSKSNTGIRFYNAGMNGQTISEIRGRLSNVLALNANGLILSWGSDFRLPTLDEAKLNSQQIQEYQDNYENDLRFVLESLIGNNTDVIAVGSPPTFIDRRYARNEAFNSQARTVHKYINIDIGICADYGVPFSNINKNFRRAVPTWWPYDRAYVTVDGVHPNKRGTLIIANLFAEHLDAWLTKKYPDLYYD